MCICLINKVSCRRCYSHLCPFIDIRFDYRNQPQRLVVRFVVWIQQTQIGDGTVECRLGQLACLVVIVVHIDVEYAEIQCNSKSINVNGVQRLECEFVSFAVRSMCSLNSIDLIDDVRCRISIEIVLYLTCSKTLLTRLWSQTVSDVCRVAKRNRHSTDFNKLPLDFFTIQPR